jgi:hypothetical protein
VLTVAFRLSTTGTGVSVAVGDGVSVGGMSVGVSDGIGVSVSGGVKVSDGVSVGISVAVGVWNIGAHAVRARQKTIRIFCLTMCRL